MKRTFEDFLSEWYITQVDPQCIKDVFEDRFSAWLEKLDTQDVIDLADIYGKEMETRGYKKCMDKTLEMLKPTTV